MMHTPRPQLNPFNLYTFFFFGINMSICRWLIDGSESEKEEKVTKREEGFFFSFFFF